MKLALTARREDALHPIAVGARRAPRAPRRRIGTGLRSVAAAEAHEAFAVTPGQLCIPGRWLRRVGPALQVADAGEMGDERTQRLEITRHVRRAAHRDIELRAVVHHELVADLVRDFQRQNALKPVT